MQELHFATGSTEKFTYVAKLLSGLPISLKQARIAIDEIQSNDGALIARRKAEDAFQIVRAPLFITDTHWSIPALNGFPGAYMKEVNQWFTATDFLNLLAEKTDRSIIATDTIAFTDGKVLELFSIVLVGAIATTPHSTSSNSLDSLALFDGKYLADIKKDGEIIESEQSSWQNFRSFLTERYRS